MFTQLWETLARTYTTVGRSAACSLIFFVLIPHFIPSTARAAVIISEIMANPDEGTEWVELVNTGEETVTISNFELYDAVSSPSLLLHLPEPTELTPNSPLVLELPSSKLNNSGDTVSLYDADHTLLQSASFGDSIKGLSWQLSSLDPLTYTEAAPTPGIFELSTVESTPTISPTPSPQTVSTSPTPVPTSTLDETPPLSTEAMFSESQILEKTQLITGLLNSYSPASLSHYATQIQEPSETPPPQTIEVPKSFSPSKSTTLCLVIGGILIAVASYCILYVVEEKNLSSRQSLY